MIGEMWDLEGLCDKAEQLGRYTCFVSSMPLKVSKLTPPTLRSHTTITRPPQLTQRPQVPGGVASPPNAVAIF